MLIMDVRVCLFLELRSEIVGAPTADVIRNACWSQDFSSETSSPSSTAAPRSKAIRYMTVHAPSSCHWVIESVVPTVLCYLYSETSCYVAVKRKQVILSSLKPIQSIFSTCLIIETTLFCFFLRKHCLRHRCHHHHHQLSPPAGWRAWHRVT